MPSPYPSPSIREGRKTVGPSVDAGRVPSTRQPEARRQPVRELGRSPSWTTVRTEGRRGRRQGLKGGGGEERRRRVREGRRRVRPALEGEAWQPRRVTGVRHGLVASGRWVAGVGREEGGCAAGGISSPGMYV
ncbi:uncharacterized protein A4U43_C05F7350 [Asparagus officinalis]|uniref:Uncharacterized protein n=1 Tax=Asparagus officinalis TaxID=4686 RepID=A0A5P1EUA9_ASPOF|nr:uncharacterized protein A4U43_C05F7350 [Asparagus officinalis]